MHGTVNHRRSIRLKDWDYTHVGMYFVTICAQNRECLFGDATEGKMVVGIEPQISRGTDRRICRNAESRTRNHRHRPRRRGLNHE